MRLEKTKKTFSGETYTVDSAKTEISHIVTQYLQKKEDGSYKMDKNDQRPIYLIGEPGIGKTELAKMIAHEFGLGIVTYDMTTLTRSNVVGMPVIHTVNGMEATENTMSEVLMEVHKQIEAGKTEGILLLDEFNCCSELLLPMALQFLQKKVLGNHELPDGWVILLCGNPQDRVYNRSARSFDVAILDRVRILYMEPDVESFLAYLNKKQKHMCVYLYLQQHPDDLNRCEKKDGSSEAAYTTPRAWAQLADTLSDWEEQGWQVTRGLIQQYIHDDRVVQSFFTFYDLCHDESLFTLLEDAVENGKINPLVEQLKENKKQAFLVLPWMDTRTHEIAETFQKRKTKKEIKRMDHAIDLMMMSENAAAREVFERRLLLLPELFDMAEKAPDSLVAKVLSHRAELSYTMDFRKE
ncbi:MAG: AAA family ATPase [Lachnospiraceae bacterium]